MKIKNYLGISVVLWLLMVQTAGAQITVLPGSDLTLNACRELLNGFEVSGAVPKVDNTKSVAANSAAADANAAVNALDPNEKSICESRRLSCQGELKNTQPCQECSAVFNALSAQEQAQANQQAQSNSAITDAGKADDRMNLLGCAIKTGRVSLVMVPYFITYFANYLLSIVAIICVLFIVLGGYFYIWGGITEKKDKGKAFITHAIIGLGISTLAWIIVNAVMAIFTS